MHAFFIRYIKAQGSLIKLLLFLVEQMPSYRVGTGL